MKEGRVTTADLEGALYYFGCTKDDFFVDYVGDNTALRGCYNLRSSEEISEGKPARVGEDLAGATAV